MIRRLVGALICLILYSSVATAVTYYPRMNFWVSFAGSPNNNNDPVARASTAEQSCQSAIGLRTNAVSVSYGGGQASGACHFRDKDGVLLSSDSNIVNYGTFADKICLGNGTLVWVNEVLMCACPATGVCDTGPHKALDQDMATNACPAVVQAGDPILPLSGYMYEHATDTTVGALSVERYHLGRNGLGAWEFNVKRRVRTAQLRYDYRVDFVREDGTELRYEAPIAFDNTKNTWVVNNQQWTSTSDARYRFEADINAVNLVSEFRLFTPANDVERYDPTSGRLKSITRIDGRVISFSYTFTTFTGNTPIKAATITASDDLGNVLSFVLDSSERITSVTDPVGAVTRYTYHATTGMLTEVIYPDATPAVSTDNPRKTYLYENTQFTTALTGLIDERGKRVSTWEYDSSGRARKSKRTVNGTDIDVTSVDYTYLADATYPRVTVTNPLGKNTIYHYANVLGQRKATCVEGALTVNCDEAEKKYGYDSNGFLALRTDGNGNLTTFVNDAKGQQTARTEATGSAQQRTLTTDWHPSLRVPTRTVNGTRETVLAYYPNGQLQTRTERTVGTTNADRVWTYEYYSNGLLQTINGPRAPTDVNDVTTFTYSANRLASITNAIGQSTLFINYDANGRLTQMKDSHEIVHEFTYWPRGWLNTATVKDPGGNTAKDATTTFTYTAAGQVERVTRPDDSFFDFTYDDAQRLTKIENPVTGDTMTYTLDNAGNITNESVTRLGVVSYAHNRQFDELNRMIADLGPSNVGSTLKYDKNGNLTESKDALNRVTKYEFDALNRMKLQKDAYLRDTTYSYNAQDVLTGVIDPRALSTQYQVDALGNLTQLTSPDTGTTNYVRDSADNIKSSTDDNGKTLNYVYDALNRLITTSWTNGQITYSYDETALGRLGKGRLTTITETGTHLPSLGIVTRYYYDARGNVVRQEGSVGSNYTYSVIYTWTLADRLASITYPDGRIVTYTRDTAGRISAVGSSDTAAPTIANDFKHAPFGGGLNGWQFWNGQKVARTRTNNGDIKTIKSSKAATQSTPLIVAQDVTYTFDAARQITNITDNQYVTVDGFTYDNVLALSSASGSYGALGWTYDAGGNRTAQILNGTTTTLTNATTSNRVTSVGTLSRAYDDAGNTTGQIQTDGSTRNYVYSDLNRLWKVSNTSSASGTVQVAKYYYNALGQRAAKYIQSSNLWIYYVYDLDGKLIAEQQSNTTAHLDYVYVDALPLALLQVPSVITQATNVFGIHTDHLGTPTRLTKADGKIAWSVDRTPFGAIHGSYGVPNEDADGDTTSITFNLRFPGQYFDAETGLSYNYFRDYDPSTGRYIQSDPIGLAGGINTYAYVGGNPLSFIDPTGEMGWVGSLARAGAQQAIAQLGKIGAGLANAGVAAWAVATGWGEGGDREFPDHLDRELALNTDCTGDVAWAIATLRADNKYREADLARHPNDANYAKGKLHRDAIKVNDAKIRELLKCKVEECD